MNIQLHRNHISFFLRIFAKTPPPPAGIQIETTPSPLSSRGDNPAFKFANKTAMNLDGPGYALTLLLVGQIVIIAMAIGSGVVGNLLGNNRAFPSQLAGQVRQEEL